MKEGILNETEAEFFRSVRMGMDETTATQAIHKMCSFLAAYYGKKVIVLLDEYDTPMQEAYVHGYWDELVAFTRSMFNSVFKTNLYLEKGIMTGITRVSRESIFSDLNNLKVITTTSDEYATSFGFTEEEVFASLEECGLSTEKEMVKRWYNGFTIGHHTDIYNPWSVINFLDTGKRASSMEPERFYHGFVLGLIAELAGKYTVTSNRESGFGRYDVMIEPKDREKDAIILEFKVYDPEDEKDLKETVVAALQQIEEKQYEAELIAKGFSAERIRKYGFAFEGKKVFIG